MAEIDVVHKQRSGMTWLWILLIVAIAAMVFWWVRGSRSSADTPSRGMLVPQNVAGDVIRLA